jgi:hypothetical protein
MTVATTLDLPGVQWQLLNRIRHAGENGVAVQLLADAGADPGDLLALGRGRLIRVHHSDLPLDLDAIEADPGILSSYDIRVALTPAGIRWVDTHPGNSLLIYLARTASGKATLLECKQNTNCEEAEGNLLDKLRSSCLVEVRDAAGRDIGRLRMHLAYSDRWIVHITAAGRRRVAQD